MTKRPTTAKAKIAITISPLVLNRLERTRLSEQCALLDIAEEQTMADTGLAADTATWPAF